MIDEKAIQEREGKKRSEKKRMNERKSLKIPLQFYWAFGYSDSRCKI